MSFSGLTSPDHKFLSGLKKKKKKPPAAPKPKPKPKSKPKSKPKPKPTPPAKESKKKDKPKRTITGKQWKQIGEAVSKAGKSLGETQTSESAKTQEMKDQLYIRRSKKRG